MKRSFGRKLLRVSLFFIGFLVLLLLAFGTLIELGFFPDTITYQRPDIPERALAAVEEFFDLEEGEEVEYLYSMGFFSFRDDGQFVTDRRLGSWAQNNGELWYQDCMFEDVVALEVELHEGLLDDSYFMVETPDYEDLILAFPPEQGGDRKVLGWLRRYLPAEIISVEEVK